MIYAFDIDGVLTDTGYNIDPKFESWFIDWSKDKTYVLVTGSTLDRTLEQVGKQIVDNATLVANCMGNSIYQEGRSVIVNEFELTKEETDFFESKMASSKFSTRAGNHIVQRPGSLNFSIVGRDATEEQREEYKKFDAVEQERLAITKELLKRFPRFDAFIGGDISIDVCLAGANKGQVLDLIIHLPNCNNEVYFFGDKMNPWGIDQPLSYIINERDQGRSFLVSKGYLQTQSMLMQL